MLRRLPHLWIWYAVVLLTPFLGGCWKRVI